MEKASNHDGPFNPPGKLVRIAILVLLIVVVVFGVMTEIRSAFLHRRMTDVDTYFRAAWAVRVHQNPYNVTDPNQWHYNYPPLLAALLYPLADAPDGASRFGMLPYAVSVAFWYLLSILFVWYGAHALAQALEKTSPDPLMREQKRYCLRWWALRLVPILVCAPAMGRALVRGQVNALLVLLLCGAGALLAYRREIWAGFCVGLAAALKLFPGFLLLYGVWRLRLGYLFGLAAALVVGLLVIPALVMGPHHMLAAYKEFNQVIIEPALGLNHDTSRAAELLNINQTDSTSFEAMIDHTVYLSNNPPPPTPAMKVAHWAISFVLVGITLLVERLRRRDDPVFRNLFFGVLIAVMLPIIPECHPHYMCMALPLVTTLLAARWENRAALKIGWGLGLVLTAFALSHLITVLPGLQITRGLGLVTYSDLALWMTGLVAMWRWQSPVTEAPNV
jgi:alpha-1,2-mannosyltransferase